MSEIAYKGMTYKITWVGLMSPTVERLYRREADGSFDESPPSESQVAWCVEWLQRFAKPRKTVNRMSSYGLKHCVEAWCGDYVSNGAFIEAARRLGFEVIPCGPMNPNAVFRLSFDREAIKQIRA